MTTVPSPLPALEQLVQRFTGRASPLIAEEMPGGASTRRFFRVALGGEPAARDAGLATARRAVAMFVPDASRPDEIAKTDEGGRRWPFLEVRDLLAERGVRVPALYAEACDAGLILVEDLGDDTLANFLAAHPEQRTALYQTAVADLARAQRALDDLPEASIVRQRAFDEDLLRWEVDHFREWGLEARGIELDDVQRRVFDAAAQHLATTIAGWPRGFVHRDYQSRNLMVHAVDGALHITWIDFQDALLGPRVYDLVALLNDSYQTFTPGFVQERLDEYASALGLGAEGRRRVGFEFDFVTVQRKLKDAGRFVFIDRKKGNPAFLGFVEPTVEKARAALSRLSDDPALTPLARLLDEVLAAR